MTTRRDVLAGAAAGALWPLMPRCAAALEGAPQAPGLGVIRAVTITAPDLTAVETAWTRYMGYRVVSRGRLTRASAAGWDAPALAGASYVVLGPESGEHTCLRFVEQPRPAGYSADRPPGWSATEITVQNTEELYERLKGSPFVVTRPPAAIPTYPYLRAMQAVGPAGEQLNLTWITERRPDLAVARSFVGRCFITVLGAPDLPLQLQFYQSAFGNQASPIRQLPSLQLAVITLADGAKIEVDQLGSGAPSSVRPSGGLPPGLALVTFDCPHFEQLRHQFIAPPTHNSIEPFRDRRAATLRGPAGELMELLEV